MAKDYYAALGLLPSATPQQIRERFHQLARERHPDRFQGDAKAQAETEFQSVTEAFNVLNDPARRRQHDLELLRPVTRPADSQQLLKVYLQRGVKAYKEGNFIEAVDNFSRATQADPSSAQAWHHLALACSRQQRWLAKGVEAIAHACELEKMNPAYLKLAGKLHAAAGMTAPAEKYYNEALTWGGDDPAISQALEELRGSLKKPRTSPGRFGKIGG
jgi:curved DNA-binding protein CbpA